MSNHTVAFFPSNTVGVLGHKYVFGPSQISFSPKIRGQYGFYRLLHSKIFRVLMTLFGKITSLSYRK